MVNNKVKQIYIDCKGAERIERQLEKTDGISWPNLFVTIIKENIECIDKDKKP